jgi:hypothetical protein
MKKIIIILFWFASITICQANLPSEFLKLSINGGTLQIFLKSFTDVTVHGNNLNNKSFYVLSEIRNKFTGNLEKTCISGSYKGKIENNNFVSYYVKKQQTKLTEKTGCNYTIKSKGIIESNKNARNFKKIYESYDSNLYNKKDIFNISFFDK